MLSVLQNIDKITAHSTFRFKCQWIALLACIQISLIITWQPCSFVALAFIPVLYRISMLIVAKFRNSSCLSIINETAHIDMLSILSIKFPGLPKATKLEISDSSRTPVSTIKQLLFIIDTSARKSPH